MDPKPAPLHHSNSTGPLSLRLLAFATLGAVAGLEGVRMFRSSRELLNPQPLEKIADARGVPWVSQIMESPRLRFINCLPYEERTGEQKADADTVIEIIRSRLNIGGEFDVVFPTTNDNPLSTGYPIAIKRAYGSSIEGVPTEISIQFGIDIKFPSGRSVLGSYPLVAELSFDRFGVEDLLDFNFTQEQRQSKDRGIERSADRSGIASVLRMLVGIRDQFANSENDVRIVSVTHSDVAVYIKLSREKNRLPENLWIPAVVVDMRSEGVRLSTEQGFRSAQNDRTSPPSFPLSELSKHRDEIIAPYEALFSGCSLVPLARCPSFSIDNGWFRAISSDEVLVWPTTESQALQIPPLAFDWPAVKENPQSELFVYRRSYINREEPRPFFRSDLISIGRAAAAIEAEVALRPNRTDWQSYWGIVGDSLFLFSYEPQSEKGQSVRNQSEFPLHLHVFSCPIEKGASSPQPSKIAYQLISDVHKSGSARISDDIELVGPFPLIQIQGPGTFLLSAHSLPPSRGSAH